MNALALLFKRRFGPLFVLLQAGTFNDNALKNSLIWLITFGGVAFLSGIESDARVPVAAFIFTGPFVLVCAIAGQIADKIDRGDVLKWVKRAELMIISLAALGLWTNTFWMLALALGMMGAQSGFFSPTKNAVLPQWLTPRELIAGNALLSGFVFVFVLVGMVASLFIMQMEGGPRTLAIVMIVMAVIGWIAGESLPPAPPPTPSLKIDFNPVTAIWNVLKDAFAAPDVLRPMLGIAWFYGLSTVLVTTLPNYVAEVMGYNTLVLIVVLVVSTIGILIGAMICAFFGNLKIWGPEAIRLSALGMVGTVALSTDIYLNTPDISVAVGGVQQSLDVYFSQPEAIRMVGGLFFSSLFSGLFVVPLQAMAQRRADPATRARLMSAGAVLLNIAVNLVTIALIFIATLALPPKAPFLIIILGGLPVALYAIWRCFHPTTGYADT